MTTKKLLIFTQTVDTTDPVLGFFHRWIEELAKKFEQIEVVCLKEGEHHLPENVRVHSLGKERGVSRMIYIVNFYRYIFSLSYDSVFVHMNEEYVVIGGIFWRLMGKRVYLWRNYHKGSVFTGIAVALSTNVLCTSKHSYTAKYVKAMLMPVGVDTERFFTDARVMRKPHSILFLSGMWPSKRPEMLIDALAVLKKDGISFSVDFYGSPLPDGRAYYESVQKRAADAGLSSSVAFHAGVPNDRTPDIYRTHELFINCSPSGMFDKTLFEAAACGCVVLSSSPDFAALEGSQSYFDSVETLTARLRTALATPTTQADMEWVEANSLSALVDKLAQTL